MVTTPIKTITKAIVFGTFFLCNHIIGYAQIILIKSPINMGLTIETACIDPAMIIINEAKIKAGCVLIRVNLFFSINDF